jgi:prepilin-type N-terminal cleavage/methylation domain-containing protein
MKKLIWLRRGKPGRPFQVSNAPLAGFSLVEMVVALAVIAVTFIGLIGLLGVGLASNQTSSEQLGATNITDSIIADLRSTPSYAFPYASARFGIPLPTTLTAMPTMPLSGATTTFLYFDNLRNFMSLGGAAPAGAVYKAQVALAQVNSIGPSDMVNVTVSWPAAAVTPTGSLQVLTQFQIH